MLCLRCSATILSDQKRCSTCGAILPMQAPTGSPSQPLAMREGVEYPAPTHHYQTPAISKLSHLVRGVIDGEEFFDELEDHLQEMSESFADFEETYASDMQALLAQESQRFPDDDTNLQLSYLLRRGLQLFEEGCQMFDAFFDLESEDPEELVRAFLRVQEGHDHLCLTIELANARLKELRKVMKELQSLGPELELVSDEVES